MFLGGMTPRSKKSFMACMTSLSGSTSVLNQRDIEKSVSTVIKMNAMITGTKLAEVLLMAEISLKSSRASLAEKMC